jgi:RsiW-degrading membrane proteinase PrsW (M82 family)
MPVDFLLQAPLALLPVLIFLGVLLHLDSFRLVSFDAVLLTLAGGAAMVPVGYFINEAILAALDLDLALYSRYGAPIVEELLKAAILIHLLRRDRIGFMVDAAILGFAIGAGFALAETLYHLYLAPELNIGLWLVRGLGTAVMHGGATAIFGVLAQALTDRHARLDWALYLPGLAIAVAVHSLFNHFPGSPIFATAVTLILLPLVLFLVFAKSEHRIHDWLLHDFQSHEHLLQEIRSGAFAHSEAGRFVLTLDSRFDPDVVADMFEYIRLHTELVLRAEEVLLAREKGLPIPPDGQDRESFERLHALERKIGKTAMLAMWPHLHFSREELAELYEFEMRARHAAKP